MGNHQIGHKLDRSSPAFHELLLDNLEEAVILLDKDLKLLYTNPFSDRLTGYPRSEVVGKACPKHFMFSTGMGKLRPCPRQCLVSRALETGEIQRAQAYLHHKEGHMLPIELRVIPVQDRHGEILGAMEIFTETSPRVTMPQSHAELERMELLDPLTSLCNRRYLEMYLFSRLEEMKRYRLRFGVLFVDIDGLQRINDSYGSAVGNRLVHMVSQTLANNIRFFEVVGRWDGDEFLVVLLNVDETKLDLVANKLRLLVEQSNIREGDKLLRTTVSIGASLAKSSDSIESLIKRTETLARQSKRLGKNRVSLWIRPIE
jgi:diguanylate cyclase (GGDEF)-like protein/PAS domain S-box-containing protein